MEPLLTTLLDLDAALGGNAELCIGGGLGLYLKQEHLRQDPATRTLFPFEALPAARTTEDIDLFLRAEVVADAEQMQRVRRALDALEFAVIKGAEYMQFIRPMPTGNVKIDVLMGPANEYAPRIRFEARRARPWGKRVGLHARRTDEAVAIEVAPLELRIAGQRSSGAQHATTVRIPQAFSYLMMKLTAFADRCNDANKDHGRHHALDVYRTIGLLTPDEDEIVRKLSARHRDDDPVVRVREIVREHFAEADALGLLRIREHALYTPDLRLDDLRRELDTIFPAPS